MGTAGGQGEQRRTEPTEEELAEFFQAAERAAWFCRPANAHEYDEIVQATVIKLWQKWDRPEIQLARSRGGYRWLGYVSRIAKNTHNDRIRSHGRRKAREQAAMERLAFRVDYDTGMWQPPAVASDAEELLAMQAIIDEIASLPSKQRSIVYQYLVMEQTPNEIAAGLGIQAQSVRKHIRKAVHDLRLRLGEAETQPL